MNITIVGGGTAGWITALYTNKIFPESNITLIESQEIGILGAGEASTPALINCFDFLGITTTELIKNTNATIKTTAKFTGWSKNEKDYFYHPFTYHDDTLSEQNGYLNYYELDTNAFHLYAYLNNISMDEYCFINKLCKNNHVPFVKINDTKNVNPLINYKQLGNWSLNFDAKLLANYLSKIAQNRGIKRIEGKVKEIVLNQDEEISDLILESNQIIKSDFVFDCTGFARLIIGKKYLSKWISYKEYLPTNKALPFFLDNKKDQIIAPYINATAMNYGWMWQTPLQNRSGCGYVFDSNHISVDEAKLEVENLLGFEIFPPKTFSFEPGTHEEVWIKNCLAVGLSAGFVEPLEASAIMQSIYSLQHFFSNKNNILTKNQSIKNNFNQFNKNSSFSIVEYIYWHYVTTKENTLFWKDFTKNNKMPDFINDILQITKERILCQKDFSIHTNMHFTFEDFLCVLYGHKLVDKQILQSYNKDLQFFGPSFLKLLQFQNNQTPILHNEFLQDLNR